jgi:23S rRNA (adenine2503-C2)-methyltransferase
MTDIKALTLGELQGELAAINEKPYRAKQIFEWLHKHLAPDYASMTNIAKPLRARLGENYYLPVLSPVETLVSPQDGTRKYLFALPDGNMIESVLLRHRHGNTVCLSTQAGCRMGCLFCASAQGGLRRSLSAGEILEQVYAIIRQDGEKITNIVVMGMGEPLDNFEQLLAFIYLISDKDGQNMSRRSITISTCGIAPQIRRLADAAPQVNLALSLHAADEGLRRRLMPGAAAYPLREVLEACRYFFQKTGRRLTFEYSLIAGVNSGERDADELDRLLQTIKGIPFHINLVPINAIKEREFAAPASGQIHAFKNRLEKYGNNVTIRREKGSDIGGACGQLRNKPRSDECLKQSL